MRIPALALAQRGLMLDHRGHATYVLRGVLVLFMLLALWNASHWSRFFGAPGLHLFSWLIYADFFFIALFGVTSLSAVITEEKESMTLGLLKLAGFNGSSILVGKSLGQLLSMALLLLVQMPFALLAITLGGVSQHQVLAAWVILLAHLLFVYALALCSSVVAGRSSLAARLCGLALLGYHLLPVAGMWIDAPSPQSPVPGGSGALFAASSWLHETSALSALADATRTGFAAPLLDAPVLVTLAMAAGLFTLAWLLFEPCTRTEVPAAPARGFFGDWLARGRNRAISRPRGHPVFWKDFQFLAGGRSGLVLRLVAYGLLLLFIWLLMGELQDREIFGQLAMSVMLLVLMLDLVHQSSRVFREEVKWRTLSTLVLLPIPLRSWGYAKVAASAVLCLPALAWFLFGAVLAPAAFAQLCRQFLSSGVGWNFLGLSVAGLHLIVYLSLRTRRAAMALAIVFVFLVQLLTWMAAAIMLVGNNSPEGCFIGTGALMALGSLAMHPAIGRLVRQKAAE